MLETEETISQILEWSNGGKKLKKFRDMKSKLKESLAKIQSLKKEIEKQRAINEENERARTREKEEMEELEVRRIQREDEWLLRKLEIEKEAKKQLQGNTSQATATQSVKLQKYTITPFTGDFKDWTWFWNRFSVEVDGSSISEISKFNYLIELTKGKPREDILGLPHTSDGYIEAKQTLLETYGKDIKVHKAIIQEIESLQPITDIYKTTTIHEFYNKLSRGSESTYYDEKVGFSTKHCLYSYG
jgi:phage-related minor tail protein